MMIRKEIKTEIVVAGGGTAGCAAALSAARMGKKVILIEKLAMLGGLATAGNVLIYLPLCDGYGKQLISGVSEELLLASINYGPGKVNDWEGFFDEETGNWEKGKGRYIACFNPASLALAMNELLLEAGVDIWYDTVVTDTLKNECKISAIECFNKSGMHKIEAECFIDATGDADLAVSAGVSYQNGENHISTWALEVSPKKKKGLALRMVGEENEAKRELVGMSGKVMSEYITKSHTALLQYYKEQWNDHDDLDRTNLYPVTLATMADFRRTRAIKGKTNINDDNYWTEFNDSVGVFQGAFNLANKSKVWEIPYGALVPQEIENLLVAGRCIDSSGNCWDHTRLIPVTAQTGDIAGIAASLAINTNTSTQNLSIKTLQEELIKQGHLTSLEAAYGKEWKKIAEERIAIQEKSKKVIKKENA